MDSADGSSTKGPCRDRQSALISQRDINLNAKGMSALDVAAGNEVERILIEAGKAAPRKIVQPSRGRNQADESRDRKVR